MASTKATLGSWLSVSAGKYYIRMNPFGSFAYQVKNVAGGFAVKHFTSEDDAQYVAAPWMVRNLSAGDTSHSPDENSAGIALANLDKVFVSCPNSVYGIVEVTAGTADIFITKGSGGAYI